MTDTADPLARLGGARADALRAAVGNAVLEGWAPTGTDLERLVAVADGTVTPEAYVDGAVSRALDSGCELGPPECVDEPAGFPDTLYPGTRVLRNRFGIRDATVLRQLEFETGTVRGYLIDQGRYPIDETFDAAHLVAIHRAMLGPVYPWAGVFRHYDMALRETTFHAAWIGRYLTDATRLLHTALRPHHSTVLGHEIPQLRQLPPLHRNRGGDAGWVPAVAEIYAYLNCAHPFREGNGRSSKTLLQIASRRLGFVLDYSLVTKPAWDGASRRSAPEAGHYRPDSHPLRAAFTPIVIERGHGAANR